MHDTSRATRVTCASPFFCERDRRKKSASSESSSTSNIFISSGAPCTAVKRTLSNRTRELPGRGSQFTRGGAGMRDTRDGKGLEYEWFCALRKQRTQRN